MSKKYNNIEDVLATITINDKIHYLIKYKDSTMAQLIEETEFSESRKEFCENYLLNRKREKSEENGNINKDSSKPKSKSNKKKIIKKKDSKDEDSSNNLSLFSMSDLKIKNVKEKRKEKEKVKQLIKKGNNKENYNENKINYFSDSNSDYKSESKSKKDMITKKEYEREGVLLTDSPEKIINVGHKNQNDKKLYSLVRWKQQKNIKILDSIVENKAIRKHYPQLLINFYESRLMFLDD